MVSYHFSGLVLCGEQSEPIFGYRLLLNWFYFERLTNLDKIKEVSYFSRLLNYDIMCNAYLPTQ